MPKVTLWRRTTAMLPKFFHTLKAVQPYVKAQAETLLSQTLSLSSDPMVKQLNLKMADGQTAAPFGEVSFESYGAQSGNGDKAKFALLAANTDPAVCDDLLKICWELRRPSVILSITGSNQTLDLDENLKMQLQRSIANVAHAAKAWIFTGGTDVGVSRLTGEAISNSQKLSGFEKEGVPCIGIIELDKVVNGDKFTTGLYDGDPRSRRLSAATTGFDRSATLRSGKRPFLAPPASAHAKPKKIDYPKDRPPPNKALLNRSHTHFLIVDTAQSDGDETSHCHWGGEMKLRVAIEAKLAASLEVPRVTLVIQGGRCAAAGLSACAADPPSCAHEFAHRVAAEADSIAYSRRRNAFKTVKETLNSGKCAFVLLEGTGGCSDLLADFLR